MSSSRMIGVIVVMALAGVGATAPSASAKPKNLDLIYFIEFFGSPFEQQVPVGAFFDAGGATGVKFAASGGGSISCTNPKSFLTGSVMMNNAPTDEVVLAEGTRVVQDECASTVPLGSTAAVAFYLGSETAIYLGSNRRAEAVATDPESPHELFIQYSDTLACTYLATKLKGKLTLGQVTLSFSKQKLKLLSPQPGVKCPKTMSFSAVYSAPAVNKAKNPLYAHLG